MRFSKKAVGAFPVSNGMNPLGIILRVVLNLLMVISVLYLPWWCSVILMFLLVALAEAWEIFVWGFLMDLLYAVPIPAFYNVTLFFTIMAVVLFFVAGFAKRKLIFYAS